MLRIELGVVFGNTGENHDVPGIGRNQLHEVFAITASAHSHLRTGLGGQVAGNAIGTALGQHLSKTWGAVFLELIDVKPVGTAGVLVARAAEDGRLELQNQEVSQELTQGVQKALRGGNADDPTLRQVLIEIQLVVLAFFHIRVQNVPQIAVRDNLSYLGSDAGGVLVHLGLFSKVFVQEPAGDISVLLPLVFCGTGYFGEPLNKLPALASVILENAGHPDEGRVVAVDALVSIQPFQNLQGITDQLLGQVLKVLGGIRAQRQERGDSVLNNVRLIANQRVEERTVINGGVEVQIWTAHLLGHHGYLPGKVALGFQDGQAGLYVVDILVTHWQDYLRSLTTSGGTQNQHVQEAVLREKDFPAVLSPILNFLQGVAEDHIAGLWLIAGLASHGEPDVVIHPFESLCAGFADRQHNGKARAHNEAGNPQQTSTRSDMLG